METVKRMIDDAYGHLHTATIQMVPRDDQIICDHVRDALVSLKIARGELELLLQSYRKKSKLLEHFSDSVKLIQDASEDDSGLRNTSAAWTRHRKIWKLRCTENMRDRHFSSLCGSSSMSSTAEMTSRLLPTKGERQNWNRPKQSHPEDLG